MGMDASTLRRIAKKTQNLSEDVLDLLTTEAKDTEANLFGRKLRLGYSGGAAMAVGMGVGGFISEDTSNSMGRRTGQVIQATPSYQSYLPQDISGGASGDLVFALNRTKGSGYL